MSFENLKSFFINIENFIKTKNTFFDVFQKYYYGKFRKIKQKNVPIEKTPLFHRKNHRFFHFHLKTPLISESKKTTFFIIFPLRLTPPPPRILLGIEKRSKKFLNPVFPKKTPKTLSIRGLMKTFLKKFMPLSVISKF